MGKILIIANARWKGGLSGSDAIYLNFIKYWPIEKDIWEMLAIEFKPFFLCYTWRIIKGCAKALFYFKKYDFVYSASDFLMDSLPAFIMKLKGNKWVAGFYLGAPKSNWKYYYSQKIAYWFIGLFADIVCITDNSLKFRFKNKKTIEVHGGVDLSLAELSDEPKIFDAVFCGRIHPSKGIDELIEIWKTVRHFKPDATLAIIGDGDLGRGYIQKKLIDKYEHFMGVTLFGYMEEERFKIYKKSKIVLYPTPYKYQHFSIAPVEAMACGCPMVAFNLPVMKIIQPKGVAFCKTINDFADAIFWLLEHSKVMESWRKIAASWAQSWDWRIMTQRVYKEITDGFKIERQL